MANSARRISNESPPERYRVGDLILDTGTQQVSRGDRVLELPKLSFDLLLALARAAPNVITIDDLVDRVWSNVIVSTETVNKRVALVRAALGDDSQKPQYIALVRGRGYRLAAPVDDLTYDDGCGKRRRTRALYLGGAAIIALLLATVLRYPELTAQLAEVPCPVSEAGERVAHDFRRSHADP